MDAKLDNFSEISKLLSVKSKMSSDNLSLFSKFGLGRLLCRLSLEKHNGISAVQLILSLCLLTIRRIAFSGSVSWLLSVLSWVLLFVSWLLFQLIVTKPPLSARYSQKRYWVRFQAYGKSLLVRAIIYANQTGATLSVEEVFLVVERSKCSFSALGYLKS